MEAAIAARGDRHCSHFGFLGSADTSRLQIARHSAVGLQGGRFWLFYGSGHLVDMSLGAKLEKTEVDSGRSMLSRPVDITSGGTKKMNGKISTKY